MAGCLALAHLSAPHRPNRNGGALVGVPGRRTCLSGWYGSSDGQYAPARWSVMHAACSRSPIVRRKSCQSGVAYQGRATASTALATNARARVAGTPGKAMERSRGVDPRARPSCAATAVLVQPGDRGQPVTLKQTLSSLWTDSFGGYPAGAFLRLRTNALLAIHSGLTLTVECTLLCCVEVGSEFRSGLRSERVWGRRSE